MKNPVPATISQVKTMARAVRISIDTQETLTPEQNAELFKFYDKPGWFFFLDSPEVKVDTANLPKLHLDEDEKSPGARLRSILFVYWKQHQPTDDFEVFYRTWIERTINEIKSKLI